MYAGKLGQAPQKPLVSCFVAPWDTSGWYYIQSDFRKGASVFSNSNEIVSKLPERLIGSDYIVTCSRKQSPDRSPMHFYLENACEVLVALPPNQESQWLACSHSFSSTRETVELSDGSLFSLYSFTASCGATMSLPCVDRFFVIIAPINKSQKNHQESLCCNDEARLVEVNCNPRPLASLWHEYQTFFQVDKVPDEYHSDGRCYIVNREDGIRKGLLIDSGSKISRTFHVSRCYEVELYFGIVDNEVTVTLNELSIVTGNKSIRFVKNDSHLEIWQDCRCKDALTIKDSDELHLAVEVSSKKQVRLDLISVSDQKRHCYVREDWSENPLKLENSTSGCSFSPLSGRLTMKMHVKVLSKAFSTICQVNNNLGEPLLKVAMYESNLYTSDCNEWKRLVNGNIGGMYYPIDCWYLVQIDLDLRLGVYDLRLDGAMRLRGASLIQGSEDAAQVQWAGNLLIRDLTIDEDLNLFPPTQIINVKQAPYSAAGDGKALDTSAIQKAVDDAAYKGSTVLLADGVFLCGEIELKSDMRFYINSDAVLLGVQDHNRYPLRTPSSSLCANRQLGRGMLYAESVENLTIAGCGTIDANGKYGFKVNDPKNREKEARPCFAYLANSRLLTIADLTFQNAAFWALVPLSSRYIRIENCNIDCQYTPNRDGIDPVDCQDMTIERCCVMAGDDGICLKSSDLQGCRRVVIRDNMVQSLASGIKFGTDSYSGFVDISISDCFIKNVNRCGLSLESVDGAEIASVDVKRIDMSHVGAPVYIVLGKRQRRPIGDSPIRKGSVHGLKFQGLNFTSAYEYGHCLGKHGILLMGQSSDACLCDIEFDDCSFILPGGKGPNDDIPKPIDMGYPEYDRHGGDPGSAFVMRFVDGVVVKNTQVCICSADARPLVFYCDSKNVYIDIKERRL